MKSIFLFVFTAIALGCWAQSPEPPYKRFPTHPPLNLLLADSTTWFNKEMIPKKKTAILILFSPDCEHCQHETEEIIKHIEELKNSTIIMATTQPFDKMKEFYTHYQLERFPNIIMGQDTKYFLPVFYDIRNLPFLAFYNKKKELISVFEGSMPIERLIAETKK